jgi:hypothetical protein
MLPSPKFSPSTGSGLGTALISGHGTPLLRGVSRVVPSFVRFFVPNVPSCPELCPELSRHSPTFGSNFTSGRFAANSTQSAGRNWAVAENEPKAPEGADPPARKRIGRPFQPGQSGNPSGRPRVEPRVRRFARRYDRKMCRVLASIAEDPKVPPAERRRAAGDLIAIGSGRPALVQEISGKGGEPLAPLVALNFGGQPGQQLTAEAAYRAMCEGLIPADGAHPAFQPRQPIEVQPEPAMDQKHEPIP